jgi:DNA-3-methyladenine glycosylase
MKPLLPDFQSLLSLDALEAAPRLLGWELISRTPEGVTGGQIVEVEAYHGMQDPASHAFRGQTPRTTPMFEAGGAIYVYRSYGIHTCLNLVTGPAGQAQAILIRALKPTVGLELIQERRHQTNPALLTKGPGRIGQALGIQLAWSGQRLGENLELWPPETELTPDAILAGPRIGIRHGLEHHWRFWIKGSPYVSGRTTAPRGKMNR